MNKIYTIKTIALVAKEMGEDEEWLNEIIDAGQAAERPIVQLCGSAMEIFGFTSIRVYCGNSESLKGAKIS
nr:hypothetical protein [uncultured Acidocella sp.]